MRNTKALRRVLDAFLADPEEPWYGLDLMRAARVGSGTLYPLLGRLEADGIVRGRWERQTSPSVPRRRYYTLTKAGQREAEKLVGR